MRYHCLIIVLLLDATSLTNADQPLMPMVEGPWVRIVGNPDLGELTSERQQPVDFAVWQGADGTWQAWSCIRNTKLGGHTRLFYRWESEELTQPDWRPMGIAMQADTSLGEDLGGLQAPHVIREGGRYHMFYGDWNHICHAVSEDGKSFERVIQPSGKTGLFSEGRGVNTRDIMILKVGGLWHGYYTAFPNDQGAVYARTTSDFTSWSESTVVSMGGLTETGRYTRECPHVVERQGRYYLFRTQMYGANAISTVYHSDDPLMFGINQDERYFVTRLAVAAPEIVQHQGQDYIVALTPELDGLQIARLDWRPPPTVGEPVLRFDEQERGQWQRVSGDGSVPFTNSTRDEFNLPQEYFIGTAETESGQLDDRRTGSWQSPVLTLTEPRYFIYVSGGRQESIYVAFVDAETDEELLRVMSLESTNVMKPQLIHTNRLIGRRVVVRVIDDAEGGWGHINFGGLYTTR
ncbi:MAG: hypothetical protein KDA93_20930 [Planctomycetaceae bacterium]|nr:hypothetical protein [Planctomycetaceae bacterium]